MIFRPAKRQDAEAIIRFQLAMAYETEKLRLVPDVVTRGVRAIFDDPSRGRYFVAQAERVAGSLLILKEWSDWRNGNVWWIHSVYLEPEFRGQGHFSKFYAFIRAMVESDADARGLRLYVERDNLKAQAAYSALGMNGDRYKLFEWMKK